MAEELYDNSKQESGKIGEENGGLYIYYGIRDSRAAYQNALKRERNYLYSGNNFLYPSLVKLSLTALTAIKLTLGSIGLTSSRNIFCQLMVSQPDGRMILRLNKCTAVNENRLII